MRYTCFVSLFFRVFHLDNHSSWEHQQRLYLTHASLGSFGKNEHVDFHNLSSKSANSDFPFTLYVLARHYTTGGTRPPFFPLRWIRSIRRRCEVQKIVRTQSYDAKILPAASYLDAGRRIKDRGRSVDTYIYRDRKPSQHVTVGLAWGSPQLQTTQCRSSFRTVKSKHILPHLMIWLQIQKYSFATCELWWHHRMWGNDRKLHSSSEQSGQDPEFSK